jgi:signal transduction histidine kinase
VQKKTTLRGLYLRTGILMLVLSLVIGLVLVAVMLALFAVGDPQGQSFVQSMTKLVHREFAGRAILPYFTIGVVLLCLAVAGLCFVLTSRVTGRLSATLKELRRAADDLREGDLDHEILSCRERELDELAQSLEGVRQRLKAASLAEAAAQEERGLLMANLSHDLRTPVTAIKGYVEGIRDGVANTPEKRDHYLEVVYAKTLVLEGLVGNMTDFSEYELGRMQYHFERVELSAFLADLIPEYQADVRGREMAFVAKPLASPATVTADRGKLKRVLDNLVSNAVKYGRPGGTVVLAAEGYRQGVILSVSDDGRGIPEEALAHVFDSFFRADAARSSSVPGSGLGLAICKSIAESHHGKLWLTSREGEGTHAYLYLPLAAKEDLL